LRGPADVTFLGDDHELLKHPMSEIHTLDGIEVQPQRYVQE
jgi:hypothetical protein